MATKFNSGVKPAAHEKRVIVGTAGHIDHGKTALVYALTGTDTDRLPEEKRRGITIDLGFAEMRLKDARGGWLNLSLIDVPGHHAFVRNMLAGTGGIDCVVLVVAADEGVKPQTEEHLAICRLLGIERGVVAMTKVDAASTEQLEAARAGIAALVAGTFLEGALVVGVSALRGDGIAELKAALAAVAGEVAARNSERVMRVSLDRAFSVRGFGTVVTGTLQVGSVRAGDTLQQAPGERVLRVRGLHVHGAEVTEAHAPCRVALNVPSVEVAEIHRGDMLIPAGTLTPTRAIDVELEMLQGAAPLKHGARVRVHAFTADMLGRVLYFEREESGGRRLARIRLAKPLMVSPGDRIVLRQPSPAVTIGGARVLDAAVPPRVRKAAAREWLTALRAADDAEAMRLRVLRRGIAGISLEELVMETGFTAASVGVRLDGLVRAGQLAECAVRAGAGGHWIATEMLEQCLATAERELADANSLSRAELRSRTGMSPAVFETVLLRMRTAGNCELTGDTVRAAGSGPAIPEKMRAQLQAVEEMYRRAGLAAPRLAEVSSAAGIAMAQLRPLITLLLREKKLIRMGSDDAFVHAEALDKLYGDLRRRRGESLDVGRFKELTGLTRKHAIPLLEHLDQVRVTRKTGEQRIVL